MPVIEVSELTKFYAGRTVIDGVSFSVAEGEIFGILGPNGQLGVNDRAAAVAAGFQRNLLT
ncbi:MAG: hypothetical protein ACTH8F_09185 [Microbacterium sp.]|uniref:hypothetical protein n=1 Tax=Microbacterium sp. TaxID=51671 RepID=UPI003F9B79D0